MSWLLTSGAWPPQLFAVVAMRFRSPYLSMRACSRGIFWFESHWTDLGQASAGQCAQQALSCCDDKHELACLFALALLLQQGMTGAWPSQQELSEHYEIL